MNMISFFTIREIERSYNNEFFGGPRDADIKTTIILQSTRGFISGAIICKKDNDDGEFLSLERIDG